jgi:hypothetical protein
MSARKLQAKLYFEDSEHRKTVQVVERLKDVENKDSNEPRTGARSVSF